MKNSPYKLTTEEDSLLTKELEAYMNEGASDNDLREFRDLYIADLKKKGETSVGSENVEDVSQPPVPPLSPSGQTPKTQTSGGMVPFRGNYKPTPQAKVVSPVSKPVQTQEERGDLVKAAAESDAAIADEAAIIDEIGTGMKQWQDSKMEERVAASEQGDFAYAQTIKNQKKDAAKNAETAADAKFFKKSADYAQRVSSRNYDVLNEDEKLAGVKRVDAMTSDYIDFLRVSGDPKYEETKNKYEAIKKEQSEKGNQLGNTQQAFLRDLELDAIATQSGAIERNIEALESKADFGTFNKEMTKLAAENAQLNRDVKEYNAQNGDGNLVTMRQGLDKERTLHNAGGVEIDKQQKELDDAITAFENTPPERQTQEMLDAIKAKEDALISNITKFNDRGAAINTASEIYNRDIELANADPKAKALNQRAEALKTRMAALQEQTGVTEEKIDQYGGLASELKSLSQAYGLAKNSEFYKDLRVEETATKEAQAADMDRRMKEGFELSDVAAGAVKTIGEGVISLGKIPKIFGDLTGDVDYDGVDALFDNTENVIRDREIAHASPSKAGMKISDLPVGAQIAMAGGDALGSIAMYAAGGGLGGASKLGQTTAMFTTGFLTTLPSNYDEAVAAGMSGKEAAQASTAVSLVETMAELAVRDTKYLEPKAFRNKVWGAYKKGVPIKDATKQALKGLAERGAFVRQEALKEGGEEIGQTGAGDFTKIGINEIKDKEYYTNTFDPEAYAQSAYGGLFGGGGASAPRAMFSSTKKQHPIQERVMVEMAERADEIINSIEDEGAKAEATEILIPAKQSLDALKAHTAWGTFDDVKQNHLLTLEMQKKAIEETGLKDPVTKANIQKIDNEINEILSLGSNGVDAKLVGTATTPQRVMTKDGQAQFFINEDGDYELDFAESGKGIIIEKGEGAAKKIAEYEIATDTGKTTKEGQKNYVVSPTVEKGAEIMYNGETATVNKIVEKNGEVIYMNIQTPNGSVQVRKGQGAAQEELLNDVNERLTKPSEKAAVKKESPVVTEESLDLTDAKPITNNQISTQETDLTETNVGEISQIANGQQNESNQLANTVAPTNDGSTNANEVTGSDATPSTEGQIDKSEMPVLDNAVVAAEEIDGVSPATVNDEAANERTQTITPQADTVRNEGVETLEQVAKPKGEEATQELYTVIEKSLKETPKAGSVGVGGDVNISKPKVGKYDGVTDFEVRTPEQLNVDDVLKRDKPIKLYPEQIVPIDNQYSEKESNWVADRDIVINEGYGSIEIKKGDKLFIRVDNPANGDATSSNSYKVYIKGRSYPLSHFIPETAEHGSLNEPNHFDAITQMKNFDKVISGEIETPQQSKEQRIKIAETLIPNKEFYVAKPYNSRSGFESPKKVILKDGKWLRLRNDEWDNTKDYEYNVWGEYADKNELAWDIVSNARVILKDKKSTNLQEQWNKQFDYLTSENKKRVAGKVVEQSLPPQEVKNKVVGSGVGDVKSNWNYEGEGDAFASNKDSRDGKSAYVIRVLDKNGRGNSYNRAKQRGELDTESPLTYEGDKESVSAIDGNGNTVGFIKLQTDGGVEHIVVAPEFSRKGVASELIKQIEQKGAKVQPEKSKQISPDAAKLFNKLQSLKETPKAGSVGVVDVKRNVQTQGVSGSELIDHLADFVKQLVATGIKIDEALNHVFEAAGDISQEDKDAVKAKSTVVEEAIDNIEGELNNPSDKQAEPLSEDAITPTEITETASAVANRFANSEMSERARKKLTDEVNDTVRALTVSEIREMGQGVVDGLGGLDSALAMLKNEETRWKIPLSLQSFIYGEAIKDAQRQRAANPKEADKWLDREAEILILLAQTGNEAGKFNAFIYDIYKESPYGLVREMRKRIDEKNKLFAPDIKENVEEIAEILDSIEGQDEAFEQAVNSIDDTKTRDARIAALEKRIKELEAQEKTTVSTPSSKVRERYKTRTKPAIDRIKQKFKDVAPAGLSIAQSPITDPELWKDLSEVAGYVLESGAVKFKDFYAKLKKELGGAFEEQYGDLYVGQAETAKESGNKAAFETFEQVENQATELFQEKERLQKEKEALKKEVEIARKVTTFGRMLSEGLPTDAQKKTKIEKLKELASELDGEIGGDAFSKTVDDFIGITKEEKDANETKREIANFGKLLSEAIPKEGGERKTKVEKLTELAKTLDKKFGTSEFSKHVDDFIGITKEEKDKKDTARQVGELAKMMSVPMPTVKDKRTRESKMKERAAALDAKTGGTAFSDAVDTYWGIKKFDAKNKKISAEIKSKENAFARSMSQKRPDGKAKDSRTREERMRDAAKELDIIHGGNTYSKQVDAYFSSPQTTGDYIKQGLVDAGFYKIVGGKAQVDWKKVTTDSKSTKETVAKISNALGGKLSAAHLGILEKQVTQIIEDKKKSAIEAKIKAHNRYSAARVLNKLKTRNKITNLLDLWKQGDLTNKQIQGIIGKEFGFIELTKDNEKWIENKIIEIDQAPDGSEKELLEEQLQAYLESVDAPYFMLNRILERNKARLLSGFMTQFKNMFGGAIDAIPMTMYKTIVANAENLVRGQAPDTEVFKMVGKAHRKAVATFLDILLNGGVDTGLSLSATTETKEGSPRVRYMENERKKAFQPLMKKIAGKQVNVNVVNWEKYPQRFMAAVDAFNQVIMQDTASYAFIKNDLLKKDPTLSYKEASRKAYEIANSQSILDTQAQVKEEFKNRGIPLSGKAQGTAAWARFNRRVHEIIEQKRGAQAIKKGQYYANRYTYKAIDAGATTLFVKMAEAAQKFTRNAGNKYIKEGIAEGSKEKYVMGKAINAASRFTFDAMLPFVKSVGNIVEKQLEMIPAYGFTKSGLAAGAAVYNKATGKNVLDMDYTFARAGEYAFRASIGMMIVALAKAYADDDDEEKAIYGEGSPSWQQRISKQTARPENTIRIKGHDLSFNLMGSIGGPLYYEGAKTDARRYGMSEPSVAGTVPALMSDLYLESASRLIEAARAKYSGDDEKFDNYISDRVAEMTTRLFVPFTSALRQSEQIRDPKKKELANFGEKLLKYSGLIGGWANNNKAVDYRGREYDMGDVYSSSADGVVKSIQKHIPVDEVDKVIFEYSPSTIIETKKGIATQYGAEMTKAEYFEFRKKAGKKFDELITKYVNDKGYEGVTVEGDPTEKQIAKQLRMIEKKHPEKSAGERLVMAEQAAKDKRIRDKIKDQIGALMTAAEEFALGIEPVVKEETGRSEPSGRQGRSMRGS